METNRKPLGKAMPFLPEAASLSEQMEILQKEFKKAEPERDILEPMHTQEAKSSCHLFHLPPEREIQLRAIRKTGYEL
jgi:hypothetical protein